jgi:hypothetical protein
MTIRKEVRLLRARDVVDWIDWFVSLEGSLSTLSRDLVSGLYTPSATTRYELGKSHGAFRVISAFNMRDAIVYRHICDEALQRALPKKVAGAFFSRRHSATPVGNTLTLSADDYHTFFDIWLKFNQYRTHTSTAAEGHGLARPTFGGFQALRRPLSQSACGHCR